MGMLLPGVAGTLVLGLIGGIQRELAVFPQRGIRAT